jgi:hypothetical protein
MTTKPTYEQQSPRPVNKDNPKPPILSRNSPQSDLKSQSQLKKSYSEDDLLNRVEAAKYLGGFKPRTLAVWDCTKRYDLQPIKVGRKAVRYRRSSLDRFLKEYMSP